MSTPEAERVRTAWLAPIEGVFRDLREDLFALPDFSYELEPGVIWRSKTKSDQRLIDDWFRFYQEYVAKDEIESARSADSALRSDTEHDNFPEKVTALILALSLHTRTPLAGWALHFDLNHDGEVTGQSGNPPSSRTLRLRGWNEAQPITRSVLLAVTRTYADVARIRALPDLGVGRSLGAYRGAISRGGFVDVVPILACASLEALVASDKSAVVIRRVIPRYASADPAEETLKSLYKLRHWFAHGATIPEMREADVRLRVLDDGLTVIKEILRAAYADQALVKAGESGVKAVRAYLDK
jgi:hypothetical protein